MHANYNEDYSKSVPDLLDEFNAEKTFVIIGGDMNHLPGYKMSRLLVLDETETTNFFTNYSLVPDSCTESYTKVQLTDPRCGLPKAYDGFFVTRGDVIISGSHTWSKEYKDTGSEYPVLKTTDLVTKLTI